MSKIASLSITARIVSLRKLESILGVPRNLLREVYQDAETMYRPFEKVTSSKVREIDNSIGKLKYVQEKIDKKILKKISLPPTMLGGVPGKSIVDNAKYHLGKKNIVHLDLKNCFPETKDKKIFSLFQRIGYSTNLAALLTRITTYKAHVPQGAPSSTSLINLVLLSMHDDMQEISNKFGLTCTFWVDDINISGDNPQEYLEDFIRIIHKHGYSVRRSKVEIMRKFTAQTTTGLLVNNEIRVPRAKILEYRRDILSFKGNKKELVSLEGKICYVSRINKKQGKTVSNFLKERKSAY